MPEAMIRPFEGIHPRIADDAFIAPGSTIVGDVEIGSEANIWYGCVLRGDDHKIVIGARSNVQDGTVIHVTLRDHPTEIGEDVVIGHGARLHGCIIEPGSLIGIGAVVLDGVVIERGSFIAAGALVPPGKRVAAGQLWAGNPARHVRDVTEEEHEFILWDVRHYVKLAKKHRDNH